MQGAPHQPGDDRGPGARQAQGRSVQPGIRNRDPFDPGRVGRIRQDPGRQPHRYRRHQARPAAARPQDHRSGGVRQARRTGCGPADGRFHERGGARLRQARDLHRPRARPRLRRGKPQDHRGQLLQPCAPRAAGGGRGAQVRAQGRLRRPFDGAQHVHRRRTRLLAHPRRHRHRPEAGLRRGRSPPGVHVHRLPGRADGRARPHRRRQPPRHHHPRVRHGDPGQLPDSRATSTRSTRSSTNSCRWAPA